MRGSPSFPIEGGNMDSYQITDFCHRMVREHIKEGDLCIDATMGNGGDTEFLCRSVGESGKVLAFDIQQQALEHTGMRLKKQLHHQNYELFLMGHEKMEDYAEAGTVSCILFNLGYLPSGDHALSTKAETTIKAMEAGLRLLKKGGIMSVCIYSGGDSGYAERNAVLEWLKNLDHKKYLVLLTAYYNRPNDPPIPVQVIKL